MSEIAFQPSSNGDVKVLGHVSNLLLVVEYLKTGGIQTPFSWGSVGQDDDTSVLNIHVGHEKQQLLMDMLEAWAVTRAGSFADVVKDRNRVVVRGLPD